MQRILLTLIAWTLAGPLPGAQPLPNGLQQDSAVGGERAPISPGKKLRRTVVVPVQDADHPARTPFHHSFELNVGASAGEESAFAVPERWRLIIDSVAIEARGNASEGIRCSIAAAAAGGPATLFVALRRTYQLGPSDYLHSASQAARAYADPGTDVTTTCSQDAAAPSTALAVVSIVGHLIRP
jgi:hypothetical protein